MAQKNQSFFAKFLKALPSAIMLFEILIWLFTSAPAEAAMTIIAVLIHEAAHIAAGKLCRVKFQSVKLSSLGAKLSVSNVILPYPTEIFICASGPIANIATAIIVSLLFPGNKILVYLSDVSIALALLNILPIEGFDGGGITKHTVSLIASVDTAEKTLKILSFTALFCLWCISVYIMMRSGKSLSLFLYSIAIFSSLFRNHKKAWFSENN